MDKNNVYWCCTADFGQHDANCKHGEHAPVGFDNPIRPEKEMVDTENQGLIEL